MPEPDLIAALTACPHCRRWPHEPGDPDLCHAHPDPCCPEETMAEPTPAEIEAGTQALLAMGGLPTPVGMAEAVLAAVLPDHDARVRAAERAKVAEDIAAHPGPDPSPASPTWWAGYREATRDAARIARAHSTGEDT